jgi:hypothetical protein
LEKKLFVPKINGFYVSPGTLLIDAKRSIQSRFKLYKKQLPIERVAGKPVLDLQNSQTLLSKTLTSGKPFAAGRLGTVEGDIIWWRIRNPRKAIPSALLMNGKNLAGIFPVNQSSALEFADLYLESVGNLDLLGVRNQDFFSGYYRMESQIVERANPSLLCSIDAFSPLGLTDSWVKALSGKRVLVIHPFSSTVQKQYQRKRREIFPDKDWLPDFHLQVYKPFQTAGPELTGSGTTTWKNALQIMLDDISKLSFDVALISAGAYGLPLATGIKDSGRIAIHVGGVLQLFFGIRGGRWDPVSRDYPFLSKYHSDAWVRPSKNETPEWGRLVEGGAYW